MVEAIWELPCVLKKKNAKREVRERCFPDLCRHQNYRRVTSLKNDDSWLLICFHKGSRYFQVLWVTIEKMVARAKLWEIRTKSERQCLRCSVLPKPRAAGASWVPSRLPVGRLPRLCPRWACGLPVYALGFFRRCWLILFWTCFGF